MEPVELVNPSTGKTWTARTAIELNDLKTRGYRVQEARKPSPKPRVSRDEVHAPEYVSDGFDSTV